MNEKIELIFMELRFACLSSVKYFLIFYMFIEWVILLHDCYALWARPMWRFIFTRQTATCPKVTDRAQDSTSTVFHAKNGCRNLLGVDMKIIMERLGMFWDRDDKKQIIGTDEVLDLFADEEPSLDEVNEAFCVFDRNKDGYIDAKELQSALSDMGYIQISESDCRLMIDGYDVDKDAKISFREFLKLTEDCFR